MPEDVKNNSQNSETALRKDAMTMFQTLQADPARAWFRMQSELAALAEFPETRYREHLLSWNQILKPLHSFGVLEELIARLVTIQEEALLPDLEHVATFVFAADNGIVAEGVSQSGQDVTAAVLSNMASGQASVAVLSRHLGVSLFPCDLGVACPYPAHPAILHFPICPGGTRDFLRVAAMSDAECKLALLCGFELAHLARDKGFRLLAGGEMGIGNTSTSTALIALLLGVDAAPLCGRGAGLADPAFAHKQAVLTAAVARYKALASDPLAALAAVGGLDIAALCGLYLGAACYHLPVLLDGIISYAAVLCAVKLAPAAAACLLPTHLPREKASQAVLHFLRKEAPLDLDLALGEGAGALFLLPLLRLARAEFLEMPHFADSSIAAYIDYAARQDEAKE